MSVQFGVGGRAKRGETISGDVHVIVERPNGFLAAVIDGLGHGPDARRCAESAAQMVRSDKSGSLREVIENSHERLRGSRGVVLGLASFDARDGTLAWLGVGNVRGTIFHCQRGDSQASHLPMLGGVVGFRLPKLVEKVTSISPGDALVLLSDGVSEECERTIRKHDSAETIASEIIRKCSGDDDATAIVVRFY